MNRLLLSLTLVSALSLAACGDIEPAPEPTSSPASALPECPTDKGMLYFAGCANAPASHVCNDARGVQVAKDCVIHDAEGTLTATCVSACP